MVSEKIIITCETGLHLRPAGDLCKIALEFPCKIELTIGDKTVNAKSVLGVLSACVKNEDEVLISCSGEDEEKALASIIEALASDFVEYHKE